MGGGDTALTDALVLANYAETVYLIHRRAQFRGSPLLQRRVRENPRSNCDWTVGFSLYLERKAGWPNADPY